MIKSSVLIAKVKRSGANLVDTFLWQERKDKFKDDTTIYFNTNFEGYTDLVRALESLSSGDRIEISLGKNFEDINFTGTIKGDNIASWESGIKANSKMDVLDSR